LNSSDVLIILFVCVLLLWFGLSACVVLDRLRYDAQQRAYRTARHEVCNPVIEALPHAQRSRALRSILLGLPPPMIDRLAADMSLPPWVCAPLAIHILSTRGIGALLKQASRSGRRRWKRVAALGTLTQLRSAHIHGLLRKALRDPHDEIADAAVTLLGKLQDRRAAAILVVALRRQWASAARIATQLDRFSIPMTNLLLPLLADSRPHARYWGVRLLAHHPDADQALLAQLADDPDPAVRKAVVQTLMKTGATQTVPVALALLRDPVGFVRAHAVRALAGRIEHAGALAILLADREWCVRMAAREALVAMGAAAAPPVVAQLQSSDMFAREGATLVLNQLGILHAVAAPGKTPDHEHAAAHGAERRDEQPPARIPGTPTFRHLS